MIHRGQVWPVSTHVYSISLISSISAVDRGFEPQSCQTKDYKIGICCFSAKHDGLLFQWASTIKFQLSELVLINNHLLTQLEITGSWKLSVLLVLTTKNLKGLPLLYVVAVLMSDWNFVAVMYGFFCVAFRYSDEVWPIYQSKESITAKLWMMAIRWKYRTSKFSVGLTDFSSWSLNERF